MPTPPIGIALALPSTHFSRKRFWTATKDLGVSWTDDCRLMDLWKADGQLPVVWLGLQRQKRCKFPWRQVSCELQQWSFSWFWQVSERFSLVATRCRQARAILRAVVVFSSSTARPNTRPSAKRYGRVIDCDATRRCCRRPGRRLASRVPGVMTDHWREARELSEAVFCWRVNRPIANSSPARGAQLPLESHPTRMAGSCRFSSAAGR